MRGCGHRRERREGVTVWNEIAYDLPAEKTKSQLFCPNFELFGSQLWYIRKISTFVLERK